MRAGGGGSAGFGVARWAGSRSWVEDTTGSQSPLSQRVRRPRCVSWIITAARERNEKTMTERLSAELLDASNNRGNAVKKREDVHRMAEANRAFSHYRW